MVRFDRPCRNKLGALNYFAQHMAKGDYLTQHGQSEMIWYGKGAVRLGLSGQVDPEHFARLCDGKHPVTGKLLGARNKGADRRVCYFGQISAPKDVSLAYMVGGDDRIAGWWEEAVRDTLREIEATTATRLRKRGQDEDHETSNMVAAVVTHDASRSLDPQLHTHVCIMNVTYDPTEARWKSVQPLGYFTHQGYFREVCYAKLAQRMREAGYELEKTRPIGFHVRGIPPELRQQFSKRREAIEAMAESLGVTSQDGLQGIASRSRASKQHVDSTILRQRWREEAGETVSLVKAAIASADGIPKRAVAISPEQAFTEAEAHLFERVSVTDERILLREALVQGRGYVELDAFKIILKDRIATGDLLREGSRITSRNMLRLERECVGWARRGRNRCPRMGDVSDLSPSLSTEQRNAVAFILNCRDRVMGLEGDAGTGKTTVLKEVVRGIEQGGERPFACAPSSGAAAILRQELVSDADTLQQLLVNSSLQEKVRGRTILVDEAGLISTRQMHALCALAERNGNRLLLVGDIKQHGSVEAGDAFRALQKYGGIDLATLTEIHRQRDPGYRKAVELFARRKPYDAFKQLESLGAVRQIREPALLFAQAAEDYVKTLQRGHSCLAVSPVWSDIHQFSRVVRTRLREEGFLQGEDRTLTAFVPFQWTKAEKKDARNYQPGDVLQFYRKAAVFEKGELLRFVERIDRRIIVSRPNGERFVFNPGQITGFEPGLDREVSVALGEKLLIRANDKPSGLKNGDIVEVAGFGVDGSLRLKDGRTLPLFFRQFAHGYATTSHAAQGKTVDRGLLMMTDEALKAANLKQAYVSNSRFRLTQIVYTSDRKEAREAMATPAERQLALELKQSHFRRWKIFEKIVEAAEAFQALRQRRVTQQTTKQRIGYVA
ncbi:conjugative relaxase domain-containing protein, TrwC/TraI family [Verrucomicrobium sp. GAS474]|uniref:MobF family relaxase n=1 Tax=Verrucomicrobium sp. GAS474 TaxID=1882831 RepID=UPI000879F778|nr:MobF family relaxase [Verrucomicrobium sp. GAS474]SDT90520.1 conjugative relaxase domain-containing protein, TrwC/TraI family [Verrucomicrobium sp. GAS474]